MVVRICSLLATFGAQGGAHLKTQAEATCNCYTLRQAAQGLQQSCQRKSPVSSSIEKCKDTASNPAKEFTNRAPEHAEEGSQSLGCQHARHALLCTRLIHRHAECLVVMGFSFQSSSVLWSILDLVGAKFMAGENLLSWDAAGTITSATCALETLFAGLQAQ